MSIPEVLGRIGKRVAPPVLGLTAMAAGTGYLMHKHNQREQEGWDPDDPNKPGLASTIKEGLLDFGLGDKYADVHLMGFPMRLSDIVPNPLSALMPAPLMDTERAVEASKFVWQHEGYSGFSNRIYNQDKLKNWYTQRAESAVNSRTSTIDYGLSNNDNLPFDSHAGSSDIRYTPMSSFPFRDRTSNGVSASGDMVFGMYNKRMG